jgi:hypothetical protein
MEQRPDSPNSSWQEPLGLTLQIPDLPKSLLKNSYFNWVKLPINFNKLEGKISTLTKI